MRDRANVTWNSCIHPVANAASDPASPAPMMWIGLGNFQDTRFEALDILSDHWLGRSTQPVYFILNYVCAAALRNIESCINLVSSHVSFFSLRW